MTSTSTGTDRPVRVRMAPSPTGSPHVGLVRTALFNWAFARHAALNGGQGTFVFRIEDTDKERSTDESLDSIIDLFQWLGLDWDEGPGVGGPHAPYKQSERSDLYADALARLRGSRFAYDCYCTNAEVDERRKASGSKVLGYDGFCRELTDEQTAAFVAEDRQPVARFRMPDGSITWHDLVRGDVTFETQFVPDFALCRANGDPLYTLVNPVDDALMEITHVLRGEDLLSSTPRQIALHEALIELGIGKQMPEFGHLPYVMGEGNKKLSKRDPEAHALAYRDQGYLPEGLLNYLALLGWAIAADRDVFTLDEMVAAFDIKDVNANPARFDIKKCDAINTEHMKLLPEDEIGRRIRPFLVRDGVISDPATPEQEALLVELLPLVAPRLRKLAEAPGLVASFFMADDEFTIDEAARAKILTEDGLGVVKAAYDALAAVGSWTTAEIEAALNGKLVDELGLKPRVAFGPVRVATSGAQISPPLFESLEILGRDRALARLQSALG